MAQIHKRSVQESLNVGMGTGGEWTVSTSGTAGSNADDTNTIHFVVASTTGQLGVYSDVEIYFSFTADAGTDINVSNDDDLKLPANTLTFITIPRGLGNTIALNYISTTTTTGNVRIVQV